VTFRVKTFVLGPIENNSYLLYDDETKQAAIIDPSFEPNEIVEFVKEIGLVVEKVFITHGHFDHFYGLPFLKSVLPSINQVCLHREDLELWKDGGGAKKFLNEDLKIDSPNCLLEENPSVSLGEHQIEVRHTPGHTPGSVIYYSAELESAFCGDLIFYHGIGRTDLPGGDMSQLVHSIQKEVFTLPAETKLLSGHGPATTIAEERKNNPFLS
jgi:hydroxyacylglutathione hydrolase